MPQFDLPVDWISVLSVLRLARAVASTASLNFLTFSVDDTHTNQKEKETKLEMIGVTFHVLEMAQNLHRNQYNAIE